MIPLSKYIAGTFVRVDTADSYSADTPPGSLIVSTDAVAKAVDRGIDITLEAVADIGRSS